MLFKDYNLKNNARRFGAQIRSSMPLYLTAPLPIGTLVTLMIWGNSATAGCTNYVDGSMTTEPPRVEICYEGSCDQTILEVVCSNPSNSIEIYQIGWAVRCEAVEGGSSCGIFWQDRPIDRAKYSSISCRSLDGNSACNLFSFFPGISVEASRDGTVASIAATAQAPAEIQAILDLHRQMSRNCGAFEADSPGREVACARAASTYHDLLNAGWCARVDREAEDSDRHAWSPCPSGIAPWHQVSDAIAGYESLDSSCRGSTDSVVSDRACEQRDAYDLTAIFAQGWCLGRRSEADVEFMWHGCETDSMGYDIWAAVFAGVEMAPAGTLQGEFERLPSELRTFVQSELASAGYYTGTIDGTWGPRTETALMDTRAFLATIPGDGLTFDIAVPEDLDRFLHILWSGEAGPWLRGERFAE